MGRLKIIADLESDGPKKNSGLKMMHLNVADQAAGHEKWWTKLKGMKMTYQKAGCENHRISYTIVEKQETHNSISGKNCILILSLRLCYSQAKTKIDSQKR